MPQERLPKQALLAKANGKKAVGRLRPRWINYIEDLGLNRLELHPSKMMEAVEGRVAVLLPACHARGHN